MLVIVFLNIYSHLSFFALLPLCLHPRIRLYFLFACLSMSFNLCCCLVSSIAFFHSRFPEYFRLNSLHLSVSLSLCLSLSLSLSRTFFLTISSLKNLATVLYCYRQNPDYFCSNRRGPDQVQKVMSLTLNVFEISQTCRLTGTNFSVLYQLFFPFFFLSRPTVSIFSIVKVNDRLLG